MGEITLHHASDLDQEAWRQLQGISRDAFMSVLDRPLADIDTLVEWAEPEVFYRSHADPNSQVGKRYNAHQAFTKPRVAVAIEAGEPIGFAYSAHNVSGATEHERRLKRLSIVKNYIWLREVAVRPDFQRQGIARRLGQTLLKDAMPLQPPTAYVWPDENSYLQSALERIGFIATGEQPVTPFGENTTPVRQVRMQARSARSVLDKLDAATL